MNFLGNIFGSKGKGMLSKNAKSETNKKIDLCKVYPRIKGIYDDLNPDPAPETSKGEIQLSHSDSPIFRPLAKGIAIFYMVDEGDAYDIIQNRHLTDGITIEKIHEHAIKNMVDLVADKTEIRGDSNDAIMVTNGGNFEATMLLADYFWEYIEAEFHDKVYVAIPAKDLLFITGKNNPSGLENLKGVVRKLYDENAIDSPIVRNIYERIDGNWSYVETV
jgi:uncharacterized protein YtpQ (UPF0354 family)